MTIILRPEQEKAIQQALETGLIRSVDEFIDHAIESIPRSKQPMVSREEAVRRMLEFGEKHKLNLGEPVTRKLMHEGHRY
jgi:hypothetical protein